MPNLHIIPSLYPNNPMTHALILPDKLAVAQPAGDHTVSGGAGGWDMSPGVYDSRAAPPPTSTAGTGQRRLCAGKVGLVFF